MKDRNKKPPNNSLYCTVIKLISYRQWLFMLLQKLEDDKMLVCYGVP